MKADSDGGQDDADADADADATDATDAADRPISGGRGSSFS